MVRAPGPALRSRRERPPPSCARRSIPRWPQPGWPGCAWPPGGRISSGWSIRSPRSHAPSVVLVPSPGIRPAGSAPPVERQRTARRPAPMAWVAAAGTALAGLACGDEQGQMVRSGPGQDFGVEAAGRRCDAVVDRLGRLVRGIGQFRRGYDDRPVVAGP